MSRVDRRGFLKAAAGSAIGLSVAAPHVLAIEEARRKRMFTMCLSCGPIGVSGDPRKVLAWAGQFGFEAIEPLPQFLATLSEQQLREYLDEMKANRLAWGAAGLPVQFRGDDGAFEASIKPFPDVARVLERAGVTRVATWLSPAHTSLTYMANFRLHARRLRQAAAVLGDHGLRLGLEYVGPKTSWSARRFPFIHTIAEMKDLIAEINRDNVGFLLDSWHWYTAQETEGDLLSLRAADVVLCHVNDAPKGVAVDQQVDNRRGLPCSTGVIDMKTFLGAMVKIGYDGPVVCEPFTQELRGMTSDQALATVAAAMKKAFALVE